MVRTPAVPVNGNALIWARQHVGLDIHSVADRLQVRPERVDHWERNLEPPSLARLRQVADLYGQTIAFFMRPTLPEVDGSSRPPDFRGQGATTPSLALMREMDRALHRRKVFLELGSPADFALDDFVFDSPEEAGERLRARLAVSDDYASTDSGKALKQWITLVENLGVLVFQMSRVEPRECQGLSLFYSPMPIVILNGADDANVRSFTLFHELGHILHRSGALCELEADNEVERECNAFAASFLLPREPFLRKMGQAKDPLTLLGATAQHFGVSWSAVAVRLRTLGLITQQQLDNQLQIAARVAAENLERRREKARASKGGPPHHVLKLRNLGPRYVESVLDAFHENRISATDASYFLESKQGVIAKMERELIKGVTAE